MAPGRLIAPWRPLLPPATLPPLGRVTVLRFNFLRGEMSPAEQSGDIFIGDEIVAVQGAHPHPHPHPAPPSTRTHTQHTTSCTRTWSLARSTDLRTLTPMSICVLGTNRPRESTVGMSYDHVIDMITSVPRPMQVTFAPPGATLNAPGRGGGGGDGRRQSSVERRPPSAERGSRRDRPASADRRRP